jgi:transcriptional regulator with PAS, ATPase and Fis domain
VAINCAAIPADLLEAEMFGIGDGVASGVRRREGCFREARGGTLFLDEVGEMAPALQAKLLRALQERKVRPVGGRPVPVDARIVAATNVDFDRQLADGRLRTDLYYRLAGVHLRVPPLRERPADVPALAHCFLGRAAADAGRPAPSCTGEVLSALAAYPWPGNVRELEHQMRRLVHLAGGREPIGVELLPPAIRGAAEGRGDVAVGASTEAELPPADGSLRLDEQLGRLESRLIREALGRAGSISRAARLLGISRNGLKMKARRHGIGL